MTVTKLGLPSCPAPQTITITSIVITQAAITPQINQAPPKQSTAPSFQHTSQTPISQKSSPALQQPSQAPAPQKSSAPASKPSTSTPAPTPQKSNAPAHAPYTNKTTTCPTNVNGAYQYPHLIVSVSSSSPNKAEGTSYNGEITPDTSSIFNFDIPSSYTSTCSLVFLFPEQSQLQTSSYTFSGNGEIGFKQLNDIANQSTTYANQGGVKTDFGKQTVQPGSSTVVSISSCPAGQTVNYEVSSVSGTSLEFFQD